MKAIVASVSAPRSPGGLDRLEELQQRLAGDRAKVAVFSRERDVDPVGACVGMKGTRVQAIIRELRGEKIDIVEFSEDPVTYVTKSPLRAVGEYDLR